MDNFSCTRAKADIKQIERGRQSISVIGESVDYLGGILELAGNTVRLKILFLLHQEKRLCVCDLSDILNMTVPAISQHLRKMKDRKMIDSERDAQTIFYSLNDECEPLLLPYFNLLETAKLEPA